MNISVASLATTSTVKLDKPAEAFDSLVTHLKEDEVPVEFIAKNRVRVSLGDTTLAMEQLAKGMRFHIEASNTSNLYLWRQGVVDHVAELAPEAALDMRWSDVIAQTGDLPPNFRSATVIKSSEVLPGLQRVELALEESIGLGGIHVRLLIHPEGRTPIWPVVEANGALRLPHSEDELHIRSYTVRQVSDNGRHLTFDIVQHPGGLAAAWAMNAEVGTIVGLLGPAGGHETPDTDGNLIIAGDMTALPAMARILEALPTRKVRAWAACPSQKAADAYFGVGRVTAILPEHFDEHIVDIFRQEIAPDAAWFAGELSTAKTLRSFFKNNWLLGARRRLSVGYWDRSATS